MLTYTNQLDTLKVIQTTLPQVKRFFPSEIKKTVKCCSICLVSSAPSTRTPTLANQYFQVRPWLKFCFLQSKLSSSIMLPYKRQILFQKPNPSLKLYTYFLCALWGQGPDLLFTTVPGTAWHTVGTQLTEWLSITCANYGFQINNFAWHVGIKKNKRKHHLTMKLVIKSTTWNTVFPKVQDYQSFIPSRIISSLKKKFLKICYNSNYKVLLKIHCKSISTSSSLH